MKSKAPDSDATRVLPAVSLPTSVFIICSPCVRAAFVAPCTHTLSLNVRGEGSPLAARIRAGEAGMAAPALCNSTASIRSRLCSSVCL